MRSLVCSSILLAALVAVGCSSDGGLSISEATGTKNQSIWYGSADTVHQAVAALVQIDAQGNVLGACSGTVVATKASSGYLLTAGHCVVEITTAGEIVKPLKLLAPTRLMVIIGNDWLAQANAGIFNTVVEAKYHPSYSGDTGQPYDFAMVRFSGISASTQVISIATTAEDKIATGTSVDIVGYGTTESNASNTVRNHIVRPIKSLNTTQMSFDQKTGGMCHGDSGGPVLWGTGTSLRVVGVNSFVAPPASGQECLGEAVSGRVSSVLTSFVKPFIDGTTGVLTCDECQAASTSASGSCGTVASACGNAPDCTAFSTCINACTDNTCYYKCYADHAPGAQQYGAITDCICKTGCATECGTECAIPKCGLTVSSVPCNTCFQDNCCAEGEACVNDVSCTGLLNCTSTCTTQACVTQCKTGYSAGAAKYDALISSYSGKCANCDGAAGAGGSGGAAGAGGGTGGTAGSGTAGSGTGGSAGSGTAGSGGGTAGSGTGGTAGSGTAGSGTAGSGTAGSGTAGSGTAGSGTAGSGTAGSGGGTAGASGDAGSSGEAGSEATTPADTSDKGCGCSIPRSDSKSPMALFGLAALVALRSFRRRANRRQ